MPEDRCTPNFTHEEHTADVIIQAWAPTLEGAFEEAARGTFEVITDTGKVAPTVKVDIEEEGFDLENLLYRWIEALLFYFDTEQLVFSRFKVHRIRGEGEEYRLAAEAWGERFDAKKHEHRTIVKAMTYADMEIKRDNGCWRLRFVVDI